MTSLRFTVNNLAQLQTETANLDVSTVSVIGKNGYTFTIGAIPILVDNVALVDVTGGYLGNLELSVGYLDNLFDDNFYKHILETNDGAFLGLKGDDYFTIPVLGTPSDAEEGFVGYKPEQTNYSALIVDHDLANNKLYIKNSGNLTTGASLYDVLPSTPFYGKLNQILDTRYFANSSIFIGAAEQQFDRFYNVSTITGTYDVNLGVVPSTKKSIKIYIDNIQTEDFDWTAGNDYVTINLPQEVFYVRAKSNVLAVPRIEVGDNISFSAQNVYSVIDTTYSPSSAKYNAALTANSVFKIYLEQTIRSNTFTGRTGVNISPDIVVATIGNINLIANTFTVDYNESAYPGQWELANNKVYALATSLAYERLPNQRNFSLPDVADGVHSFRVRSSNRVGRKSPFVAKSIIVSEIPVSKVQNLAITESLYKDTTQGVLIRLEVTFDHILNQDVTKYEISYKLEGESEDLIDYTTVLIPAVGVSNGKMRYVINNIDRGRTIGVNEITVKVIPITGNNVTGPPAYLTQSIIGKTGAPLNVTNLAGGQQGQNLIFVWKIPTNSDGTVVDIDLNEIEIRRYPGEVASADLDSIWLIATPIEKVATPAHSAIVKIEDYGLNTYMFRTKDTSGIYSDTINYLYITTSRPADLSTYKAWNEDDPSTDFVTGITNENSSEYNYPSFANSNTGGLSYSYTTSVDNSNGTSTGLSILAGLPTDLFAAANAVYQTQIRDVGESIEGYIINTFTAEAATKITFNDFQTVIYDSVTESDSLSNVLVDTSFGGIGHVLGYANANAATVTYNTLNMTLMSGGQAGNVYAIWLEEQFAGDGSNANAFAFIAGTINTNAIALGKTYYANGYATNSNVLPNLHSNSLSYSLVDLQQFIDDTGSLTFAGQADLISTNVELRTANASAAVFYANGNVNVSSFINSAINEGWQPYTAIQKEFRYFQLRYSIRNDNPNLVDYTIDKIRYTIDLQRKSTEFTVNVTSIPTAVDYSDTGFTKAPSIDMTPLANASLAAVVIDHTKDGANIAVFDTITGTANTNVDVLFRAGGI